MPQVTCPGCGGAGRRFYGRYERKGDHDYPVYETCGTCGGSGRIYIPDTPPR